MTWPLVMRNRIRVDGREYRLTPLEARIFAVLLIHRGRLVTKGELIEAVYPDPEREPDWAENCIEACLCRAIQKFDRCPVETVHSRGWIIPLPPPKPLPLARAA